MEFSIGDVVELIAKEGYIYDKMAGGSLCVFMYCKLNDLPLPEWFGHKFGKNIPNYCRHRMYPIWNRVFIRVSKAQTAQAGEVYCWLAENISGRWCCDTYRDFYIENPADAMLFRLVWG